MRRNPIDRQPLPRPTPLTQGFWDAARRHQLVVQRCETCGLLRHYPRVLCPSCRSDQVSWQPVSGKGAVYSLSITHQPFNPAWTERVPYAVATIELDEGVRMVSDLPDTDVEQVAIGARVEVFFDDVTEGVTLPRFRLVGD
jgi:uncharacterized OB-fold protein